MTSPQQPDYRLETRLVHEGHQRTPFGETSEALFLTQGFVYESAESAERRFLNEEPGYSYSRYSNPTVDAFEQRIASLEGAVAARATASGMAAVTAAMVGQVQAGDHVVAARALFGSCRWVVEDFLPRFGVGCTLVDGGDLDQWRAAVRPETKAFLLETPTNPGLDIIDIAAVAAIAHEAGATLTVDNVFATPLFQKPLALGADCVVYSATKHIDGQGRCLGGVILASTEFIETKVQQFLRMTGPSISPFNAWVLLKGLETLPLRVERQTATAGYLADALHGHPKLQRLIYPGRPDHPQAELIRRQMSGASTMIALDVKGGKDGAFRFLNALRLIRISNNLGDAKSLVTHPATTTHQRFTPQQRAQMSIPDGLVRLSVGLEHRDDLLADLTTALESA
ncbi:O-succinylhomoserine sulfhydrylase [Microvirga mediterraneensis]|uniref:O-succinylhomoserine sulfhydrylase n=1 Tax=Microvirga mediterraneensis TaxID=2754695 RepID=A0A838BLF1_9HYPH|nr:O-succinylhomoserine sulfhydrylase [Microvirga mediterraneensis]MBA1155925.1 O-succinylhomoserine sulfhydrylase [Microvirga mediterraneensis]